MSPIAIDRLGHVAVRADDPQAAAAFATENLGLSLAYASPDGAHYMRAHGPDPYVLVYTPGVGPEIDHVAYLVTDDLALGQAATHLDTIGVQFEHLSGHEHDHAAAIRFRTPSGICIELTTGLYSDRPVAHVHPAPRSAPGPIVSDHIGIQVTDIATETAWLQEVLGLVPTSTIVAPDPGAASLMTFLRARDRYLYHQIVVAQSDHNGPHHLQFSLKNLDAFDAALQAMGDAGVEIGWGPLRHSPGHNIAFYFQDGAGYWVEYSVEEEIILDDDHYVAQTWLAEPKVVDEWNSGPPPADMMPPSPPQGA